MLGRACGRDPEWLGRLSDADGAALSIAMWETNGPFFIRLAVMALRGRAGAERLFARVLDELVRAGHGTGHADLAGRLTWRQIELFWKVRREGE